MTRRMQVLVLFVLAPGSGVLSAQGASTPPAELGQLASFLGNWQCTGRNFAQGDRPEAATAAVGHAVKAVDGHWIQFGYAERATSANPTPYIVAGYMGYDPSKKQFVQSTVDVTGYYGPSFSDGWKGDTLTFEGNIGQANGTSTIVRDHFVKKGRNTFVHFAEAKLPDGDWVRPDEETCHIVTR